SHSCWASLRVAVASLITITLLSCAAAPPAEAASRPAAIPQATSRAAATPLKCLLMLLSPNGLPAVSVIDWAIASPKRGPLDDQPTRACAVELGWTDPAMD